ncbi:MAG: abortive infection family protein [Anaerolineales bacterium]
MANLSSIEKIKLEKLFEMGGGYVLDFSNRTFQEFFADNFGIDIYDAKYNYVSGSKANRLRAFWSKEPNHIVGKSISFMLEYWKTQRLVELQEISTAEQNLADECNKIAERLSQDSTVENIDVIQPYVDDKNFSLLAKSIRESIYKDEPETALDRLHTFVVKYIRQLCDKHQIAYDKKVPLHSLFGSYVKFLVQNKLIESEMTERILKSSIAILESFNKVRNDQSFAHDNSILNYNESMLIFNNVANVIKFIESVEKEDAKSQTKGDDDSDWNLIPF